MCSTKSVCAGQRGLFARAPSCRAPSCRATTLTAARSLSQGTSSIRCRLWVPHSPSARKTPPGCWADAVPRPRLPAGGATADGGTCPAPAVDSAPGEPGGRVQPLEASESTIAQPAAMTAARIAWIRMCSPAPPVALRSRTPRLPCGALPACPRPGGGAIRRRSEPPPAQSEGARRWRRTAFHGRMERVVSDAASSEADTVPWRLSGGTPVGRSALGTGSGISRNKAK